MSKYDLLNERQQEAVYHTEGPMLILAGAGSGKTRVLTHRTAYLMEEMGVNPWHIMAITFTNKAAAEMRERIDNLVGYGSDGVWVSTFHSACVRILRRYIDRIGYDNSFTIYDADDQKTVMKEICKRLNIDTKKTKERAFLNAISAAKDELISPEEFTLRAAGDYAKQKQAQVYREYQQTLKKNNALDFDDLIFKCVELLRSDPEVLDSYQERLRYIMVDEYQDTNTAQFEFVRLLASKYRNLCVVGDDDQSIYRFRGANIYNILNFEQYFPDAKVVKLEENYRSTQNILDAANAVIKNNEGRKEKTLWTKKEAGDKISLRVFDTAFDEAEYVAYDINSFVRREKFAYGDCAILYRTNAQSRLFEERFVRENIPYKIVGGVNFYSRKEIKDILAYLKTVDNAQDDLAVKRIINVPKRGIGATTINKVQDYADENDMSFYTALKMADEIPTIGRAAAKIRPFVTFIQTLRSKRAYLSLEALTSEILEETGYVEALEAEHTEEAEARIENIDELISKIVAYEETEESPTLSGFLEEVALIADIDSLEEETDYVVLMTLHSAKGLEFPNVYLVGMEDGLFPGFMTITSDDATEMEEERRLCYVGITRAREHLTMTTAHLRMVRGETQYHKVSRFVREIPDRLLDRKVPQEKKKQEEPVKNFGQVRQNFARKPYGISNSPGKAFEKTDLPWSDSSAGRTDRGAAASFENRFGGGNAAISGKAYGASTSSSQQNGYGDRKPTSFGKTFDGGDSKFPGVTSGKGTSTVSEYASGRGSSNPSGRTFGRSAPVSFGRNSALKKPAYGVGDRVSHMKFGAGIVRDMVLGGRDYEVTVEFDKFGVKKMFASFANLKKL